MESLKLSSYCGLEEKPCVRWVENYFKDCLCNMNDGISFALGIASLIFWGVAEIPQIITNFKNNSADGVSLAFIFTWILGDVFNLVGCILEPATLPTQFYTAVLYTTTTVVLALQCIYYDHFKGRWKCQLKATSDKVIDQRNSLLRQNQYDQTVPTAPPIDVPQHRNFYFMSARSLAGSDTPNQSYMKTKSGPPALEYQNDSSSEDENEASLPPQSNKPVSQPRLISRSVGYGTFFTTTANLPLGTRGSHLKHFGRIRSVQDLTEFHGNAFGQWLGWLMAAIYMGGRIPQIWLNIKRGSVEGLNPLMFIFALIANATYVGSILMRSTELEKIKANMPWLLDAVVCVGLDLFIILQYVYYRFIITWRKKNKRVGEYYVDYKEANKPLVLS